MSYARSARSVRSQIVRLWIKRINNTIICLWMKLTFRNRVIFSEAKILCPNCRNGKFRVFGMIGPPGTAYELQCCFCGNRQFIDKFNPLVMS